MCDFTYFSAAFCGSMCWPAIQLETMFWSLFDGHAHRLRTETAGEPLVANFVLNTFSSGYEEYAHLKSAIDALTLPSSWQVLNRGGSLTSTRSSAAFRYSGVHQ